MRRKMILPLLLLSCKITFSFPEKIINAHPWEPVEITLQANSFYQNSYTETTVENGEPYLIANFECNSCKVKSLIVPGFWDGNKVWKIRFSAPEPGTWNYTTHSKDKGLNGKKGTLSIVAWSEAEKQQDPCRRGFIVVNDQSPRAGRYFIYADGTPFLWIGDTWWNWTKKEIAFDIYKNLVDTRATQGFSVGQLFFPGNGWGSSSCMLDSTYSVPDLDHIRRTEEMIRYANEKGITVWIHAWWCRKNMDRTIGPEKIIRWWKYVVDRLSAYNVVWVLAGEYNMYDYGSLGLNFWNRLGSIVENEDPYQRIISVHPTPPGWDGGDEAPQWSTADVIHDQPWLKYNQSQVGHGKWRNEMIPLVVRSAYQKNPAKPIVVTEPWYEFIDGNPSAMDIRFGAWSAILSGAAGHTYGGGHVWRAHVAGSPAGGDAWPLEKNLEVNTLVYPGAQSIGFLSKFLRSIDWWKLEPHPELVIDNPSRYCSADLGKEYLVYLRYGGRAEIDLTGTSPGDNFSAAWIDLTSGKVAKKQTLQGGQLAVLDIPEDYPGALNYKDWLIHLKKQ